MTDDFGKHIIISTQANIPETDVHIEQKIQTTIDHELKSQIYHNLSCTSNFLLKAMNMTQSLTKKDLPLIQSGLPLPQFNFQYSFYLPQSLENQFLTRFPNKQFSYVYDNTLQNLSVLQLYNKEIITTLNLDEINFQDRFQDSIRIVTNYDAKKHSITQKTVLLLLDFYQHPLTVAHFIQFLTRSNYKVVCPYLPDIILKSALISPDNMFPVMVDQIKCIHEQIIKSDFQIVAHGTSAAIGLALDQFFGMQSVKVILCNPQFNIDTNQHESDDEETLNIYRPSVSSQPFEFSIEHVNQKQMINQDSVELSTIESVHNNISEFKIVQKQNQKIQKSRFQPVVQKKIIEQKARTFSLINQLIVSTEDIALESNLLDDLVQLVNSEVSLIYKDVTLLSGLMKAYNVNKLSELELITDIKQFSNIFSPLRPVRYMYKQFLRMLYGIFIFSPLEQIEPYHKYKSVFDRHFFESFRELKWYLFNNTTRCTDDMNIYNLISSHDCLLTEDFLKMMGEANRNFKKMHCRTIVGAGHDLFSVGGSIIEKLLR
ncbi:Conserved_hypothetical protein [Hexamita inflata]|uniref:Uncharacterized protein n=1 Tax=Hexamita inflata TaxID=28002 RepID=A0AA86Q1I5_9EUKA|nr:Conserved hypothetical protein [Hexamita inflata]